MYSDLKQVEDEIQLVYFGDGELIGDLLCKQQQYLEALLWYDSAIEHRLTSRLTRATACINKLRLLQRLIYTQPQRIPYGLDYVLSLYDDYLVKIIREPFAQIVFLLDKAHLAKKMGNEALWQTTYDTVLQLIEKQIEA